jgi:hypothetical protein
MATKQEVENFIVNSPSDLCKLAEMLGYDNGGINQLQCRNGAWVSSLIHFFEDNPGALEAVKLFVDDNILAYDLEVEEDEEEETSEENCPGCDAAPGDGASESCFDEAGCGYYKKLANT